MGNVEQVVPHLIKQFGGERTGAYSGDVGLGDADHPVDVARPDTGSGACPARHRIRGRHEGIGAVVDVQEGGLGTLHEHPTSSVQLIVDETHGVAAVGSEPWSTAPQLLLGPLVGIDR